MSFAAPGMAEEAAKRLTSLRQLLQLADVGGAEREVLKFMRDHPRNAGGFALYARCASARSDWPAALQRWLECRQRFPSSPLSWRLGLGYAFINMERFADAELEFSVAFAERGDAAALAGKALVVSRSDPPRAEPLWQQLSHLSKEPLTQGWQTVRARALVDSGDTEGAYAILRTLLDSGEPATGTTDFLLGQVLIETGRRVEAAKQLEAGRFGESGAASKVSRLRLQFLLRDLKAVRANFCSAVQSASSIAEFEALFSMIAGSFERFERAAMWRRLQHHVEGHSDQNLLGIQRLLLGIELAQRNYEGFLSRLATVRVLRDLWGGRCNRVATALQQARFPDFTAPKVFGIGLSRTATTSLNAALEVLGYLSAHFSNPFSGEILTEDDFAIFDAGTDTSVAYRFETLYWLYPNARFVLTTRPFDSWLSSFDKHFCTYFGTSQFAELFALSSRRQDPAFTQDWSRIYNALYYRYDSKRAAYDAHERRVAHFFADKPPGKLLRHDCFADDGWDKLCGFLGREVPREPYPFLNRGKNP